MNSHTDGLLSQTCGILLVFVITCNPNFFFLVFFDSIAHCTDCNVCVYDLFNNFHVVNLFVFYFYSQFDPEKLSNDVSEVLKYGT